jgi:hypothetical protein
MKPTLKVPGTERLKLKYDRLLSNLPFKFDLRRYIVALDYDEAKHASAACRGAHCIEVGRCKMTLSNPR